MECLEKFHCGAQVQYFFVIRDAVNTGLAGIIRAHRPYDIRLLLPTE